VCGRNAFFFLDFQPFTISLILTHKQVRVWSPSSSCDLSATKEKEEASLVIHSGENIAMAAVAWEDGRGLVYGCDGKSAFPLESILMNALNAFLCACSPLATTDLCP